MNPIRVGLRGILLSLWLALTVPAVATTYYLDSVAGSDSNSGTSSTSPWGTLNPINHRAFAAGDTIELKCGSSFSSHISYGGTTMNGLIISSSGTAASPITFTTYGTGAAPLITNDTTYGDYSNDISLISASYIVINGLKLTTASLAGVYIDGNSNHNLMENCEVTNTGEGAHVLGQYNLCTENNIHDTIMVVNDAAPNNDHGANGFVILNSNNEFSYNTLTNCAAPSHDYGTDGGAFELYDTTNNISIHHNWAVNCEGFLEAGAGVAGCTANNCTLDYNVSLNNSGFTVLHNGGSFVESFANFAVENNTVVETTTASNVVVCRFDAQPPSGQFIFQNNIFYLTDSDSVYKSDPYTRNNNLYEFVTPSHTHILNSWGNTLDTGEIKADPLFVNLANDDFTLSPGSPALGAGVNLGFTIDDAGISVPASPALPSMGGYESRILTENFNEDTIGSAPPTHWGSGIWASVTNTSPFETLVQGDSGNIFGEGTANNYLLMASTATSTSGYGAAINTLPTAIPAGVVSFNFYQPTVSGATGSGFILRVCNGTLGNGSTAFALSLKNGGLYLASGPSLTLGASSFATYALDHKHTFALYFNNNASATFSYTAAGTVYNLAAGTMDIWIDGTRVGTGLGKAGGIGTGVNLSEINFISTASFIGTLDVDDLLMTPP